MEYVRRIKDTAVISSPFVPASGVHELGVDHLSDHDDCVTSKVE